MDSHQLRRWALLVAIAVLFVVIGNSRSNARVIEESLTEGSVIQPREQEPVTTTAGLLCTACCTCCGLAPGAIMMFVGAIPILIGMLMGLIGLILCAPFAIGLILAEIAFVLLFIPIFGWCAMIPTGIIGLALMCCGLIPLFLGLTLMVLAMIPILLGGIPFMIGLFLAIGGGLIGALIGAFLDLFILIGLVICLIPVLLGVFACLIFLYLCVLLAFIAGASIIPVIFIVLVILQRLIPDFGERIRGVFTKGEAESA